MTNKSTNEDINNYYPRSASDVMMEMETFVGNEKYRKKKFVLLYWEEFKEQLSQAEEKGYKRGKEEKLANTECFMKKEHK